MNECALDLKNPPIVEAVVDIECDFRPGQTLAMLEERSRQVFRAQYPKFRVQY